MLYIILPQLILAIFIGCSIFFLAWLFPVERKSAKKNKMKKV